MPINYLDIENGVVGYSQKDYQLKRHTHFPIEVAFSLSGYLNIEVNDHQYSNIQSIIINSNIPHTFSCLNSECQLFFIEPTSSTGKHILKNYFSKDEIIVLIDGVEAEHFKENHILPFNNHNLHIKNMDNRIQRCLDWIDTNYASEGINISMIAKNVFLSEGRLAHLFKEQVGISIQQYVLWKKTEMSIIKSLEGLSLTECAYLSGFNDSSHFTKTFKKMFGIYPSFAKKK